MKDLGSSNGTYVNGDKIEEAHLNVGDEVKLDTLRFLIQTPGMPEPASKEASQKNTAPHGNAAASVEGDESGGSNAIKWLVTLGVLGGAVFAAWKMDKVGALNAMTEIAAIKVVAPNVLQKVVDDAIQIHGGAGVSQDTPLTSFFIQARSLRLADGPDEVHKGVIARIELAKRGFFSKKR